ncbi:hypothetical protein BAUCODRAFT_230062 [Baudoinia panamericana UAMH 10762]|uniref:Histidine kinase n=1 Tax=Baudoinia panamericana (strain UAMH 10762) TaxID=717646 RepID=M2LGH8_BAUPA|nr:uncharacterized protein BAUCODRAFT_230062 [Baudoinia panamericana UAMH 10762]EMC93177.1 hypothetical protein BAUCODRAFT_230062 [Baudoinia panamericana UAMH 10762]
MQDQDGPNALPSLSTLSLSDNDKRENHGQRAASTGLSDRIFANTPVPTVILDQTLTIRHVSKSYYALSSRTPEELIGENIYGFVEQKVPVPDVATVRGAIETAIATGNVQTIHDIPTPDGSFYSMRTTPIVEDGELLYIIFEIENTTQEHMRQTELREQLSINETFRILVETVKDYAIFMLDPGGHVSTWNAGAQNIKQYTREDIVGKHFSNFYGDEDRAADKPGKELVVALRDGKCEDEGWRYRKDGTKFWANVVITPVYRNDILIGFSKVTRDLTERRAAETRLISAYEESDKLKSEFLANMSHEIRTPMHGMLTALTLLIDTGLNAEQKELSSIISDSGRVLLQLINDVLDYSKLASGSFSVGSGVVCIPDIIVSVTRHFQTTTKAATRLETSLDPRIPQTLEGDALRYRQIVQNLIANAVKFTESGVVTVTLTLDEESGDSLTLLTEVSDTGIGVPQRAVGTLFTPFTQFDNSATKRYGGTGLGLSICKTLAELMGGQIGFRPNDGGEGGSVFWFTVKLRPVRRVDSVEKLSSLQAEGAYTAQPTDPLAEVKRIATGKRLLLAEDNQINSRVMLRTLKSLGFVSVDPAMDGMQALSMVKQESISIKPYDLVLMDINMPLIDGVTCTVEIRKAGIDVPIVAMTANALKGQAEAYLAKGMDDYITKPVDRGLLVKVLARWLRNKSMLDVGTKGG